MHLPMTQQFHTWVHTHQRHAIESAWWQYCGDQKSEPIHTLLESKVKKYVWSYNHDLETEQ